MDYIKLYQNSAPGQLFKGKSGYYIKPMQYTEHDKFTTEGGLIDIFTGDIVHYSHLLPLKKISHLEIMW